MQRRRQHPLRRAAASWRRMQQDRSHAALVATPVATPTRQGEVMQHFSSSPPFGRGGQGQGPPPVATSAPVPSRPSSGPRTHPQRPATTATTVAVVSAPLVEGRYTVVFEDGEHRSLQVQPAPPGFRAGPLVVCFQCGPDAGADYRPFAHISRGGEVRIWARYRHRSVLVEAVRVLVDDPRRAASAYGMRARRCFRCQRPLSRPESIARAMGPRCARLLKGQPASSVSAGCPVVRPDP